MRKAEKVIVAILAGVVLFSMSGCSGSTKQQDTSQNGTKAPSGTKTTNDDIGNGEWADFPKKLPDFSTKDLEGKDVTNDILKDKELTVVNVWGTFCSPCIDEMPELGKWAADMPDNVQIIGLIVDVESEDDGNFELANKIVKKADADFRHIIANEEFKELLDEITGVPTTFFVDAEGNIVGTPILGADVEAYKRFVEDYINGQKKK